MKTKRYILFYYALLLIILASRQSYTTAPPMVMRIAFMVAVIAPSLINKKISFPAIITMFYTISLESFSFSYMPYTLSLYVIITMIITGFYIQKKYENNSIPIFIILLAVYTFLIDLITGATTTGLLFQNTFFCLLMIICFLIISRSNTQEILSQLPLCFSVTTIVLGIAFLTHREEFIMTTYTEGMERTGWTDPNYFGVVMGMGGIIGVIKMFSREWRELDIIEKAIYVAAVVLSLPVLALNASRGAMLAYVVGFVTLMMLSKVKSGYKIIVALIAVIAVFYLYTNQYFELLEYRIMSDEGGSGSGRIDIWKTKLDAYLNGNILTILFGNGHYMGSRIGGFVIGFHSDFVGFLVDYGVFGLGLLLYTFYYPIKVISQKSPQRVAVISLIAYLATSCFTLEPLLTGILAYFSFYLYALLLAKENTLIKTYVK
ncbi:MAG: O-antigen ligase family protein [bacterium]|nr:O-antigen ligase family protein [Candidatus Limimorpha caballi]